MMSQEMAVLLRALEAIGQEWQDHRTPGDLMTDKVRLDLLLKVDELAWQPGTALSSELVAKHAPAFFDQFQQAALRKVGLPFGHSREVVGATVNG